MKKSVRMEKYQCLLEDIQDETEEKEKELEVLRKEERHIKLEMEKLR